MLNKYHNSPSELQYLPQWVCWRYEERNGKRTKIPKCPYSGLNANVNEPTTWGWHFDACKTTNTKGLDGIGFVLTESDPYVGIDIDNCIRLNGSFNEEGNQALAAFGESYHEISPSGKGLRFLIRGTLPTEKSGSRNSKLGVEVYHHSRYLTVTGNIFGAQPKPILDCNEALQSWYAQKFSPDTNSESYEFEEIECPVSAETIIAKASSDDPLFAELFNGNWDVRYASHSEADLALCTRTAYWTGPDPERIDDVFHASGLYRDDKWGGRHDYRKSTIDKAVKHIQRHPQGFHDWDWTPEKTFGHLIGKVDCSGLLSYPPKTQQSILVPSPSLLLPATKQIDFGFIDSATFAAMTFNAPWLVNFVLKDKQPCIIAGPSKSMKTTFLVELAISLASGLPLWNEQKYSTVPQRVALISAESGEETLQETAKRICQSKGITLESLSTNLFWAFRPPDISSATHLLSLKDFFLQNQITVSPIDPAYLCMGDIGDSVNNQFSVGAVLQNLSRLMQETGATPILAAHTGKGVKAGRVLELLDIAHAGFCQWARQWILVNRRAAYDAANPGCHQLYVSYGGSAGHSGSWSVDINEGCVEFGRTWSYSVRNASEVRNVTLPGIAQAAADQDLQRQIMEVITDTPTASYRIAKQISKSPNGVHYKAALAELVQSGQVAVRETEKAGNSEPIREYSRIAIATEITEAG